METIRRYSKAKRYGFGTDNYTGFFASSILAALLALTNELTKHQTKPMSENNHEKAALEVWGAIPYERRQTTTRADFITAFTLGRVSMKACFDNAELLRADDEPKPFTPEQTNQ